MSSIPTACRVSASRPRTCTIIGAIWVVSTGFGTVARESGVFATSNKKIRMWWGRPTEIYVAKPGHGWPAA